MNNRYTFVLALILALSSLIVVNFECASGAVTNPSIPDFSLRIEDQSYNVAPTYTTDPYTGETKVATYGYRVEKRFINVIIQNPTISYYGVVNSSEIKLYYSIRFKGHFQEWANGGSQDNIVPDNAQVTTVAFGFGSSNPGGFSIWLGDIAAGGRVDFQVKAVNGYYTKTTTQDPICFRETELSVFTETGQSPWSDTKTITIDGSGSTTTPTESPSEYPTATPSTQGDVDRQGFNWTEISLFAALGVIAALLAVIAIMHRRQTKK